MNRIKRGNVISLSVYAAVFLVAVFGVAMLKGIPHADGTAEIFRILSDAFLIPAVVFSGVAGLSWVSSKGGYDSLRYAFYNFGLHTVWITKPQKHKHYDSLYDYKVEKDKKGRKWFPHMLYVGLAGLLLAGIFLLVWYLSIK